jgi:nucleoside-diphosphate-sugar epimerase
LELGNLLTSKGHQVTGLKRHPPVSTDYIFNFFTADITTSVSLENLDDDFEYLFFIVSPDERTETKYRDVYENGVNHLLKKFGATTKTRWFFVSSTSVYSQSRGEWVNEDSGAEPDNSCSQLIRAAELRLSNLNSGHTIVRFSGIYGPGREYLLRMASKTPEIQKEPPYYTNRIHQQDCVAVLAFLLEQRLAGVALEPCYLASDDDPAPMWEVMSWLANQLACNPPVVKSTNSDVSMNKRCDNQKLKKLGYQFRYPSYREGYSELIGNR